MKRNEMKNEKKSRQKNSSYSLLISQVLLGLNKTTFGVFFYFYFLFRRRILLFFIFFL